MFTTNKKRPHCEDGHFDKTPSKRPKTPGATPGTKTAALLTRLQLQSPGPRKSPRIKHHDSVGNILGLAAAVQDNSKQKSLFKTHVLGNTSPFTIHLFVTENEKQSLLYRAAHYKPRTGETEPLSALLETFWGCITDSRNQQNPQFMMDYEKQCLEAFKKPLLLLIEDDYQKISVILNSIPSNIKNNQAYYLALLEGFEKAMTSQKDFAITPLLKEISKINSKKFLELLPAYAKEETLPSFITALAALSFENQRLLFSKKIRIQAVFLLLTRPDTLETISPEKIKRLLWTIPQDNRIEIPQPIRNNTSRYHEGFITIFNKGYNDATQRLKEKDSNNAHLFKTYLEFIILHFMAENLLKLRASYISQKTKSTKTRTDVNDSLKNLKNELESIHRIEMIVLSRMNHLFSAPEGITLEPPDIIEDILTAIKKEVDDTALLKLSKKFFGQSFDTVLKKEIAIAFEHIENLAQQVGVTINASKPLKNPEKKRKL